MNTKNKQMALKDMINKGLNASNKKMISFRIDDKTIEKLRIIANRKKTTQTKVITELIMIAHATLYTPLGEGLNELYTLILDKGIKKKSIKKTVKNEEAIINEIKHPLQLFIKENLSSVNKLQHQLSVQDCEKLLNEYDEKIIYEVLQDMENYKPLTTKYKSVNLTLRKWIKLRFEKKNEFRKPKGDVTEQELRNTLYEVYK